MLAIRNVLVGTDFSECAGVALMYGRAIARQFGARLHVVHAVEPVMMADVGIGGYAAAVPQIQDELETAAKAELDQLLTEDDRTQLRVTAAIVPFETPARAIVDYAGREAIDLIIIGTHGRRGFTHLLMGSVAESVVRSAPCPVLTVRHPEREFLAPDALVEAAKAV